MSMIECPACKGPISTRLPKCPKCGASQRRAEETTSARRLELDTLKWAKAWAHIGAWSVVAGLLIPIPIPQFTQDGVFWGAIWFWDCFRTPLLPVGLFMPPLAGLAVLVILFLSRDELLPRFMTFIGAFTIAVEVALGLYLAINFEVTSFDVDLTPDVVGPFLTCAFAAIGAFTIAAANRVRKTHSLHPSARRLSGIGGILLLLLFAMPLAGQPPILAFVSPESWSVGWPVMVPLLGLLVYGTAGVVCFKSFTRPQRACRIMSLLGRAALALIPAFFIVLDFISFETMAGRAPGALIVLKAFLTLYGGLAIFAAGLAALLTLKLSSAPAVVEPVSTG